MKWISTACAVALFAGFASSQSRKPRAPFPDHFLIGRHTYFDFGPPTDYYELFFVRPLTGWCEIERVTVTPAGAPCWVPPSVRVAKGRIPGAVADLLGKNPCLIPEKELRRERQRCKDCLRFSGAEVVMQVECGDRTRSIRMDILDRDMFDANPRTPEHTSWTMDLLGKLDGTLGDTVMDQQLFPMSATHASAAPRSADPIEEEIQAGKYDDFFQEAPDKLSQLAHDAGIPPPIPTIELTDSTPFRPTRFDLPAYPPLAKMARVEGEVTFEFAIGSDGSIGSIRFSKDKPLLRAGVEQAVARWQFPEEAAGHEIQATLKFQTNCPAHP